VYITYIKRDSEGENEMTDQEMRDTLRGMIADWNNLSDEQKAEANAIAAEQAAKRIMEIEVNRSLGYIIDWGTGEFVKVS
jgi:hypothetical protein